VAALVLVTGDAREGATVLLGKTETLAGGLQVTTVKEGSGQTASVSFIMPAMLCVCPLTKHCIRSQCLLYSLDAVRDTLPHSCMPLSLFPLPSRAGAQTGDNVKVHYTGKLDSGKVFDSGDISFPLGAGHVIKGWDIVRTIQFCMIYISASFALS